MVFPAVPAAAIGALSEQNGDAYKNTTTFIGKALGKWAGNVIMEKRIRKSVTGRNVIGCTAALKRTAYAASPILMQTRKYCMKTAGTVFVFYAPSGMGKSTACNAVLDKYTKKGIAFSPSDLTAVGSYKDTILQGLGLDINNPPTGWMDKMIELLEAPWHENPAVLVLDDFMNDTADNPWDEVVLKGMKTAIRSRNVSIIVFTKNKKAANKMIAWNDMCSIVPAVSNTAVLGLKRAFFEFKKSDQKLDAFQIDWDKHVPMIWETSELKKAVLVDPKYVDTSQHEKNELTETIDAIIQHMNPSERKELNPRGLLHLLVEMTAVPTLMSPKQRGLFDWDNSGCGCPDENLCVLM